MTAEQWSTLTQDEQCTLTRLYLAFGISLKDVEIVPRETEPDGVVFWQIRRVK